jgi:hypothetical protein
MMTAAISMTHLGTHPLSSASPIEEVKTGGPKGPTEPPKPSGNPTATVKGAAHLYSVLFRMLADADDFARSTGISREVTTTNKTTPEGFEFTTSLKVSGSREDRNNALRKLADALPGSVAKIDEGVLQIGSQTLTLSDAAKISAVFDERNLSAAANAFGNAVKSRLNPEKTVDMPSDSATEVTACTPVNSNVASGTFTDIASAGPEVLSALQLIPTESRDKVLPLITKIASEPDDKIASKVRSLAATAETLSTVDPENVVVVLKPVLDALVKCDDATIVALVKLSTQLTTNTSGPTIYPGPGNDRDPAA